MKYSIVLLIVLTVSLSGLLRAQSPFINGLQTPLLINSGYAGSKMSPRLNAAFLTSNQIERKRNAQYVSYDQFASKRKIGWGFYAFRELNEQELVIVERLKYENALGKEALRKDGFSLTQENTTLGFSMSPKYNMASYEKLGIKSGTVSNSFGLEYTRNSENLGGTSVLETQSEVLNSDSTKIFDDSLFYSKSDVLVNRVSVTAGTKLSTKSSLFAYQLTVGTEFINESYDLYSGSQIFNEFSSINRKLEGVLVNLRHNFTLAHVFFNLPSNSWRWNNYLGVQLQHNISGRTESSIFSSEAIRFRNDKSFISTINAMSYARYKAIMFGAVYHRYLRYQSFGFMAGLNLSKVRVSVVYSPYKSKRMSRSLELSVSYKL